MNRQTARKDGQPIKSNIAIDTLRQRAMISSLAWKPTVVRALAHASRPRLIGVSTGEQQQGLFRFYAGNQGLEHSNR